jgi:hypothetical protein
MFRRVKYAVVAADNSISAPSTIAAHFQRFQRREITCLTIAISSAVLCDCSSPGTYFCTMALRPTISDRSAASVSL